MDEKDINERLTLIEKKLDTTISQIDGKSYAENVKYKKMLQQWFSLLYKELKKEISDTKKEILKEIKNQNKNKK